MPWLVQTIDEPTRTLGLRPRVHTPGHELSLLDVVRKFRMTRTMALQHQKRDVFMPVSVCSIYV